MRQSILTLGILFSALAATAQNKKDLTISATTGWLNSPYYQQAKARAFYGFDFDYHLTKRQVLGMSYVTGTHRYYDDVLSNFPTASVYEDGTNATAYYSTVAVLYKYKVIKAKQVDVVAGTGAGILTHTREYWVSRGTSIVREETGWSDLVFPVRLEVNLNLSKRWQLGVGAGFLIHPDYPILGLQAGPRLSYTIQ